jgi:CHAT domain-containing protein
MDRRKAVRISGSKTACREGAYALLAALVLGWQAQVGHTQISESGVTQAGGNGRNVEMAQKEYSEAAALSKKLTEKDLREAVRLYRASVERFLKAGTPQWAAAAEVETGNTLNMMSGYEQAITAYRLALVLDGDAAQSRCAALTGLAWTEANMGRSTDALRDAGAAVTACTPLQDEDARAYERAVEAEGEAEFWSAQVEKATATLTQARQLAAAARDVDGEALSTMLLADNVHPDDREAAHRLIASAMEMWTRSGNLYGVARGNLVLAYFAGREGNYSAAECESKSALAVFERIADHDNAAVAFNVLGMVARSSGDLEAAAEAYRRARKLFVAAKDELGEGDAISGLMDVSVDRNDTSSPELYVRGLALAQTTHNQALLATALVGTGDVDFREHRFTQARATYRKSLDAARGAKNPFEVALALGRLARGAAAEGDLDEALGLYAQALALEEQAGAVEDVARSQYLSARIYLAKREPRKALAEIEKTIAIVEQQRLRIAKFESRAQYFAWVHEYYALYIRVLMALSRIEPDRDYVRRAVEASERSKVRALIDELTNAPQAVNCDEPPVETMQQDADTPQAKEEIVRLNESANSESVLLSMEQIQTETQENEAALVEFALGEEHSFAWLLDGGRISAFELPGGAEIDRRVEKLRRALEPIELQIGESPEEFLKRREVQSHTEQKQLRELGQMLFGAMPLPTSKRLIIVPDGALQYIPFAALETSAGTQLVQRYELAMLPSASMLAALRKSTSGRAGPEDNVTVIADPLYELPSVKGKSGQSDMDARASRVTLRSAELTRALSDLHETSSIPNLPGSRLEALSIQRILGPSRTRLALGYEANRDAVMGGMLARARVVHFATHGLLDARRPENSGLILALFNSRGQAQDGYLRVSDIHGLKLSADLVVLSSCESALGKDMGSEGIIGLPRAFLYAGAKRVIASLWKVDDEAAAVLMAYFYEELKEGMSPTAALNRSQLKLRQYPKFHDPYFWSAFFLEGEYR